MIYQKDIKEYYQQCKNVSKEIISQVKWSQVTLHCKNLRDNKTGAPSSLRNQGIYLRQQWFQWNSGANVGVWHAWWQCVGWGGVGDGGPGARAVV